MAKHYVNNTAITHKEQVQVEFPKAYCQQYPPQAPYTVKSHYRVYPHIDVMNGGKKVWLSKGNSPVMAWKNACSEMLGRAVTVDLTKLSSQYTSYHHRVSLNRGVEKALGKAGYTVYITSRRTLDGTQYFIPVIEWNAGWHQFRDMSKRLGFCTLPLGNPT